MARTLIKKKKKTISRKAAKVNPVPMDERYPRTIALENYDAWQILRRRGDGSKLVKHVGHCRPIIDRALNYGHVKEDVVRRRINSFFRNRQEKEKKEGEELLQAAIID